MIKFRDLPKWETDALIIRPPHLVDHSRRAMNWYVQYLVLCHAFPYYFYITVIQIPPGDGSEWITH